MQLEENVVVAGKFRLIRLLGRGGMGSVWQAQHLALDIPCAVKFIEGDFAAVPEMATRFQREAKAAAALRSPHVVQILDHDVFEGMPYIAMELLDGEELSKRIASAGCLAGDKVNAIIGQACRALTKAHLQGIVHRDLKPDNLFLVRDDDREIVKILDFGIAKSKNPNLDIGGNTKTGTMLGTPYYMSPEQAQGNKSIDGRSDLWALGVIAYECMTGKRPFESDALGDLLMQIMVKPLPIPSTERPGVPFSFDAWFHKACARDPNNRFQTAKELSEALAVAVGGASTTDVMTAREVHAVMKGTLPLNTPNPYGASTPNPYNTPNPYLTPQGGFPGANQTGGNAAPTPFVHASSVEAPPKKSMVGVFVGIGAAVLVALVVVVVIVTRHPEEKTSATGGGGAATSTATTTATAASTATSTAATTTTATATIAATATAVETATATAVAIHTGHVVVPPTTASGKPNTHPTATATSTKGGDLGF